MFIQQMMTEYLLHAGTVSTIGTDQGTQEPPYVSEGLCRVQVLGVSAVSPIHRAISIHHTHTHTQNRHKYVALVTASSEILLPMSPGKKQKQTEETDGNILGFHSGKGEWK